MRRSRVRARPGSGVAAVGAVLMVVATACSSPPEGVDGELVNDWGGFAEPVGFVPDAPVCHADPYRQAAPLTEYQPVDCDQPHQVQTFHVATFVDDAAELDAAPEAASDELRVAYGQCEQQAAEFLGADFRYGRLWLGVAVPSDPGWQGGARWFRCDLMEIESVYGEPVERQGSLAGALSDDGDAGLSLGCFAADVTDEGEVQDMSPVSCDETHDAEFVGVWDAPNGQYPSSGDGDAETAIYEGCREQVAEYVDVPADGDLVFRTGTIADWMSEADWAAGDRAFRCYLWLPDRDLTESLAGAGTDALPIQTE